MFREEKDRIGISRAPQRPNPRVPSQPGDRQYTPANRHRLEAMISGDISGPLYKVGDVFQWCMPDTGRAVYLAIITKLQSSFYIMQPYTLAGVIWGNPLTLTTQSVESGGSWKLATESQKALLPQPEIGTLKVYIIRGNSSPLPEYGEVLPDEKIIFEAEFGGGAIQWLLASGCNFILKNRAGDTLLTIWGEKNPFRNNASARPTAPLTEGEYILYAESLPYARSAPYHFSVSETASEPTMEQTGMDKFFETLGKSAKYIAIGGIAIAGGYFLIKSGVLVSGAAITKKKLKQYE